MKVLWSHHNDKKAQRELSRRICVKFCFIRVFFFFNSPSIKKIITFSVNGFFNVMKIIITFILVCNMWKLCIYSLKFEIFYGNFCNKRKIHVCCLVNMLQWICNRIFWRMKFIDKKRFIMYLNHGAMGKSF